MGLSYQYETKCGPGRICGVDEVGRGPWAGPVVAAAVVLDPAAVPEGLNDSKKLTAKRRDALAELLHDCAEVSIGSASVAEIDALNIRAASHLAMVRAVAGLSNAPDLALIDGRDVPDRLCCKGEAIIRGDAHVASIAAASIVAKVKRDRLMKSLAEEFPGYGWDTNMGYGTSAHRVGLLCHGVTTHHRRTFKPIHNMLMEEISVTS